MPRLFPLIAFPLAATLAACSSGADAPAQPPLEQAPLMGALIGGPFELTGSDGQAVHWSDFEGKWRIVYFGYAYCPDVCPTDVQRMSQGLTIYSQDHAQLAEQIQPIFISIDPERDTPAVVGEFASAFSDRLIGLTGTPEQIADAAKAFGIIYSKGETESGGGYLVSHSNYTYLFDPAGRPVATLPVDQGAQAVAQELAKWVR